MCPDVVPFGNALYTYPPSNGSCLHLGDEGIANEDELEHHYENIDAPRQNVQEGNAASENGTGAAKDDEGSCFKRMFPTTFSRLTCALAITVAIACIVALTVFGLKTTSNPKRQQSMVPGSSTGRNLARVPSSTTDKLTNNHQKPTTATYGPPTTPISKLDLAIVNESGDESTVSPTLPIQPTEKKQECDFKATFTTLGAKGRLGPTDLGQHYSGQDHDGLVTLNNGIQHFTVKHTGTYQIEAAGNGFGI
ncbi:hypothetical protein Bbelb_377430 [Branchiostoma belcheri]|nr:hypothetical protein Bbelb_377430 [Branchiostoma belcheri]